MFLFPSALLLFAILLTGCTPTETTLRPVTFEGVQERQQDTQETGGTEVREVASVTQSALPPPRPKPAHIPEMIKRPKAAVKANTLGDIMQTAQTSPFLNTAQRYRVIWAGLHVADLIIGFRELDDNRCIMQTAIQAYGLAQKISKFKAETEASMRCLPDGSVIPLSYDSFSRLRDRSRDISFDYDERGAVQNYVIDPQESPGKRPEIDPEQLRGSFDGLSMAVAVRSKIRQAVEQDGAKQFSLRLFDGRKLLKLNFKMIGMTTERLIHVSMRSEPVAGYNDKDLRKHEERDVLIDFYIDPDTYLPVRSRGYSSKGTAHATLEENCFNFEACLP